MGYQSFIFEITHHKYPQMLLWSRPVGLAIIGFCAGSRASCRLHGFKSCLPLWCVFFFSLLSAQFRVPCTVKYPYWCWMARSPFENEALSWSTCFILRIQDKRCLHLQIYNFLCQLKRKMLCYFMINQHAVLKLDNEWQEMSIGNTKSSWMSSCLVTVVHRLQVHFSVALIFIQLAELLICSKLHF